MELIFDDKTGTWGEAPEVYGTIECPTKEDYEYALNAIKAHKQLEAKHWDECRQIAHYDNELKEAKRLLKAAVEDIYKARQGCNCNICDMPPEPTERCQYENGEDCQFKWRYADEAKKLIGGSENG